MSDKYVDPSNAALEALLRDIDAEYLELFEPPDDIWDSIEAAISRPEEEAVTVVRLDSRRWNTRRVLMGFVAALIAAIIGFGAFFTLRDDSGEILATATLDYDVLSFDALGAAASAGAHLVSDGGKLTIDIIEADLPSPGAGADLEVWLIRPDDSGNVADLVSLGIVDHADPESLEVPPGHDPAAYYVVDISVEPRDGDASHSGRSVLRGPLTEV